MDRIPYQSEKQNDIVRMPRRFLRFLGNDSQDDERGCNNWENDIDSSGSPRDALDIISKLVVGLRRGQRGRHSW